jgi:CheY-like chemotaxis protein
MTTSYEHAATRMATSLETRNILVVDDDPAILDTVAWALEEAGYTVAAVTSGREALQWIQAAEAAGEPPALILLDLAMPGMNGQQVMIALRQKWGANSAPIIILSADQQAQQHTQELGAVSALTKPFDIEQLLKVVNRFVT